MDKYKVKVVREQHLTFEVVANNEDEALMVLRNLWQRSKADAMEYNNVRFEVVK